MAVKSWSPRGGRSRRQPMRGHSAPRPWRPRRLMHLLLCCAVLASMVWACYEMPHADGCSDLSSSLAWSPASEAAAFAAMPQSLRYPATAPETQPAHDRYTVLLNSYRRPDLLEQSLQHYRQCRQVDAVRVIWSEDGFAPPSDDVNADDRVSEPAAREVRGGMVPLLPAPVVYDVQPNSSLNNRFRPLPGLRTEAVLSIDDDILVPCDEVQATFEAWLGRPAALMGWFPRGVAPQRDCRGFDYLSRDQSVLLRGVYSMVLTKGAFLHRDYLQLYSAGMPPGVHSYVDAHRNCEDIAMAFVVANVTRAPPEYVRAPSLRDLGQGLLKVKGISSIGGHAGERTACVNEFTRLFGRMPLVQRDLRTHAESWRLRLSTLLDRAV